MMRESGAQTQPFKAKSPIAYNFAANSSGSTDQSNCTYSM